jgi:hypothetical protein
MNPLDQMAEILHECIWVLPFVLNPGKLDSPENPMTVDLLRQFILAVEIRLLTRFIFSLKWGFTCYTWVFFMQPTDLDALEPKTRIVANNLYLE